MLATINAHTLTLPKGQYRDHVHEKRHIVLHYTAGYNARGALSAWKRTKWREGTAYIVDRDGQIYQVFDPRYWAVHIFRHKRGEDPVYYSLEKHSVGIEIVGLGPLSLGKGPTNKDVLYTYTGKRYCTLADSAEYTQYSWKRKHYWQNYTHAQYEAISSLVRDLSREFQIPIDSRPLGDRLGNWDLEKLEHWRGVYCHHNVRRDKMDPGPSFEFTRIGLMP